MILLVLLTLVRGAIATYVSGNFTVGPYEIYAVWNASAVQTNWLMVGEINMTLLEVVGIISDGVVNEIMCMPTQATLILIAPRACDNTNPNLAVENSNCALTPEAALQNLLIMRSSWYLPWVPGSNYQFGPPIMVGLPQAPFTDANLLQSQGLILTWGYGDNCMIPCSVRILIDMPTLIINSNCTDYQGFQYGGVYKPDRSMYTLDLQWKFDRIDAQPYQSFIYTRLGIGITFNLQLYDGLTGPIWVSQEAFTDFVSTPLGTNFTMLAAAANCYMSMTITPSTRTLLPPPTINDVNYAQNTLPQPVYQTLGCGFDVGRLDLLNEWAVPGCCPTCKCGGDVSFTILVNGLVPLPFEVRPNPLIPNMTCTQIYPVSNIVPTLGGGSLPRNFEDYLCFFPFLDPGLASQNIQQAYLQCQLFNGWIADSGRTVCMRSLGFVECRQGWQVYDQNCYYVPQGFTDANLAVTGDQAEAACNSIGATAAYTPTELGYKFLYWQMYLYQQCDIPYRVTRPVLGVNSGSGSSQKICTCYTCTNNGTFTVYEERCSCQTKAFPFCRYRYADQPVPFWQVSISPITRSILINGQAGLDFPGSYGRCICPDGFISNGVDDGCYTPTCPPIVNTTSNALSDFFDLCLGSGNGYCFNGQPRLCQCNSGWGPPASIDPALPYFENQEYPCFCPSAVTLLDQFYMINDVLFNDSTIPPVCGGFSRGACSTLNVQGVCNCVFRPVLNPEALIAYEKAYNGQSCTCSSPYLPPVGSGARVVTGYCNGKGTCCPSGERLQNEKVDGDPSGFTARCPPKIDGCLCDNGWTGLACTCPNEPDLAYGLPLYPLDYGFYVDLTTLQPVRYVSLVLAQVFIPTGCTAIGVSLGDSPSSANVLCAPTVNGTWICPGAGGTYNGFSRYVMVETLESSPSCDISVTANNDPPCGPNGNPTAGRFFANERFRSFVYYLDQQTSEYAQYGCTITACMCSSNWTGDDCTVGVSGYRLDVFGRVYPAICGSDLLPPRGMLISGSQGPYTSVGATCQCQQITAASGTDGSFYGNACECAQFLVEGEMLPCAGNGICIPASFSYGRCADDLSDQEADPLLTPFAPVAGAAQLPGDFSFDLRPNGTTAPGEDTRSVIAVNGRSYFLSPGQTLTIPTLTLSFYTCDPFNPRNPLNVTYECADAINPPVPAWIQVRWLAAESDTSRLYTRRHC